MEKVERDHLEEILPARIRKRLLTLGFQELEVEETDLLYYIQRAYEWVQSVIGIDDIPTAAERSFVDLVCADLVLDIKFGIQADEEVAEQPTERLQVGDVSVTYANGGMTGEQKELRLTHMLYDRAKEVLLGYRRVRW